MSGPSASTTVPSAVRQRVISLGEEGIAWLAGLDAVVASLSDDWGLTLDQPLAGGSEAFVVSATMQGGRPVVLKIGIPGSSAGGDEALVLAAAAGRGYAELIRYDEAQRAMLLERLGPRLDTSGLPIDVQIEILAETLIEAWRPLPAHAPFMTGAWKARSLADYIEGTWRSLGQPCTQRAVEIALSYAKRRGEAFDPSTAVLAHGDPHAANALASSSGPRGFKFVDPDGLFIEPAYDLGVVMRGWNAELIEGGASGVSRDRSSLLSSLTGVDEQSIWEWSYIERLSSGLTMRALGYVEAAEYLAAADALAREG
jgi:streptomycin 6-kinase